ncbi:hypothetical protein MRX96_005367 [Rhipicephalus microplus]
MSTNKVLKNTSTWARFMFSTSKYYQYGLLKNDMYRNEPVTLEAVRRLPKSENFVLHVSKWQVWLVTSNTNFSSARLNI